MQPHAIDFFFNNWSMLKKRGVVMNSNAADSGKLSDLELRIFFL